MASIGEATRGAQEIAPYLRVFKEIEGAAAGIDRLEPQAAYELYDALLMDDGLDPAIYLSMSITSGGFARDTDLDIGEVIAKNSDYGTSAKRALIRQHPELQDKDIILPSELSKVKGWSQSDYLLFWFHVITGLKPHEASGISNYMQPCLTLPGFIDKTLPSDERWQDYEHFTHEYVKALREVAIEHGRDLKPSNIQAMVMILDGEMSLGGRAEELLCRLIGIPPQYHYLDLITVLEDTSFKAQTKSLVSLGASALSTNINTPPLRLIGVGAGTTDPTIAFMGAFRKTGLFNALFAASYYADNPSERPTRHHTKN